MIEPRYASKVRDTSRGDRLNGPEYKTRASGAGFSKLPSAKSLQKLLLQSSVASIALVVLDGTRAEAACIETTLGVIDCSGGGPGPTFTGRSVTINADPTANFTSDVVVTGPGTS